MQIKKNNKKNKLKIKFNKNKINKKYKKIKFNKKKFNKKKNTKNNFKIKNKIKKKKINTKNNQLNKYKLLKKNIILKRKTGNIIKNRPPIITIMGHVNHGKTSLIDRIKSSNIQKYEIGNITQNINAYNIKTKFGKLTLLDTPGHYSFTDMRKKSINISDLIILLISIDDGIMPQTKEIIKYANKKQVPIIIALNKIDKINYLENINIIKKNIILNNIISNKLFKKNIFINISTKENIGINKLIKYIFIKSKLINLKTIYNGMASGIILDSNINKNIGPIAKILIKKGTLKTGNIILCGETYGKIKCIFNDNKKIINKAKPSMAVEITGLHNIPKIGKKFIVINNNKQAKKISQIKYKINKEKKLEKIKNKNIKNILSKKNNNKNLNIILKTNLLSYIKTLKKSIKKISNSIKIIYSNIGNINENDLIYAKTTNSIIVAFNVQKNNSIKKYNNYNIKIYYFSLIYKLIEKINNIYELKFKKLSKEKIILGIAIIKNIFKSSKTDIIAGCKIKKGFIDINNNIKIIRKNITIYKGKIKSIKRFKDKVKIVYYNNECGIHIRNFNKIKIGDEIISFK